MNVPAYNLKGELGEKVTLKKGVFDVRVSPKLLAQAVRVYLTNQRRAVAKTKTRGQVEGSTRKIYKQKGTGGARHGSVRAPIFVGGGIAHGPDGRQNPELKMTRDMGRRALRGAVFDKVQSREVAVLQAAAKSPAKTKQAQAWLKKTGLSGKITLVVNEKEAGLARAFRNIKNVEVFKAGSLTAYEALKSKYLVLTGEALAELEKKYAN